MKKLSRKEVFNLIVEALNEENVKDSKDYNWAGKVNIPKDIAEEIMSVMFDSWNKDLGKHYKDIISGNGKLDEKKIIISTIKSLFENATKNFYNELKKKKLVEDIMSIINDVRKKNPNMFESIKSDLFNVFEIYYNSNLKKVTSGLKLLSPKSLGEEGVSDNLNSDSKIINFFNMLGYFKSKPR